MVEAKPFLASVLVRKVSEKPFNKWNFSLQNGSLNGYAAICGVGKTAAAIAAQRLIDMHSPAVIINAGVCGAAAHGSKIGEVYRITEAFEGDLMPEYSAAQTCWAGSWNDLAPAKLTTRDMPVYDLTHENRNSSEIEVVDMEGAAIARCCNLNGVPCVLLKGVTDFADADAKSSIKKTATKVSIRIAKILMEGLER